MAKKIGIIAGNGRFPLLVIKEAHKQGYEVLAAPLLREADTVIEKMADAFEWMKVGELKKLVKFFRSHGVEQAIMAGKVEKVRLFQDNVHPDFEMVKVLMKTKDYKDDSLLGGIANYLSDSGIELLDSTAFLKHLLPGEGVLGKRKPNKEILADIDFGYELAKSIAGLDVGQTVVVKKRAVLAVEAIEGTDWAIRRGGKLGNGKITVVKVAKPNQDMRFDVPAVGLKTLKELIDAHAQAFAFEANKTLFLDQEDFIDQANRHKIVLVGVPPSS